MRRVVITGMGIWSCIGTDLQSVSQSLREGRSGIGLRPERAAYGYQSSLSGLVPDADVTRQMVPDRHVRAGMPEQARYAYMAATQALAQSRMDAAYLAANEVGCIFGNDSSAKPVIEAARLMEQRHDSALLGYGTVFQSMNSTVSMNLSAIFSLRGVNFTVSAACASGSHSVGLAYMMIRDGMQDAILCGGAQETNLYSVISFDALAAFSSRQGEPQRASRPFDRDRDGLVPSGGAAALLLEDYDHALARGVSAIAEVRGYGVSSNGAGMSRPSHDGSIKAMTRALQTAGLTPADIDYVNAHATSTPQGDAQESLALRQLFADSHALVSSTKSMTGHEMWMAGASEVVYSALMMQGGFVAPNINFENPDENSAGLNIARPPPTRRSTTSSATPSASAAPTPRSSLAKSEPTRAAKA
ncbi:beta-ketoacyl-[acyl-carrier-protein] synthase family protein [Salmonella enterica]|nr:beta-ketoacyl-[acyl-carrier-protein] synthase family protein [Salmonella enterica]